ncbi:MAG: hypothetical protein ACM3X9_07935 [Bacillota bacterium]
MLIKYRSLFMLVRVRSGRVRLSIPIPLFLLDQTLDAVASLVWLGEKFCPRWTEKLHLVSQSDWLAKSGRSNPPDSSPMRLAKLPRACRGLIDELRRFGRWRMVEVEHGNERVYIDFF